MSSESLLTRMNATHIVHYNRGEPFRTITNLKPDQIQQVIGELNEQNAWGLGRFSDPKYLIQRFEAEERLRKKFIEVGGNPELRHPIYFFLGRHPVFEKHPSNIGYSIDFKDLDPSSISFTYGDSLLSLIEKNRGLAGVKYSNPLCTDVFTLETLPLLLSHPSFPQVDPLHIEAQLWTKPNMNRVKIMGRLTHSGLN